MHVFPYSERDNTDAIELSNIVSKKDRVKRAAMLRALSEIKLKNFYEENLNQVKKVLFEKENVEGNILGFSENYIRFFSPFDESLCNKILNFKLEKINEYNLKDYLIHLITRCSHNLRVPKSKDRYKE